MTKAGHPRFPLQGLRVVNFGWVWAAPVLGHLLADLGAEVIKVESQKRPDVTRMIPPFHANKPGQSWYSHTIMRDLLSITLDLAQPQAQELARALVQSADVVIENFTPGMLKRYRLDYQSLRSARPDLVMISLSAAGQTGPLSSIVTYGNVLSCLAGVDALQGYPGERPMPFGTSITDPLMGALGSFAVLAALRHRRQTGRGQYIDLSQWEAMATTISGPLMDAIMNRRVQGPAGNRDPLMVPHGVYPCQGEDQWVTIAVKTEEQWQALCAAMGSPDLSGGPEFSDQYQRRIHEEELDRHIGQWTRQHASYAVAEKLQRAGVASFPVLSAKELFEDPHFRERGDWVEVDHPYGKETIYGVPWKLSKTPGGVQRPCPLLGQDNGYVFSELLGLSSETMAALEQQKVLY